MIVATRGPRVGFGCELNSSLLEEKQTCGPHVATRLNPC